METVDNYKQQTLIEVLLDKSYQAHDALADVKHLYELLVSKFTYKETDDFSFNFYVPQKSLYHSLIGSSFRVRIHKNLRVLV